MAHKILETAQSPNSPFPFLFDIGLGVGTWHLALGLVNYGQVVRVKVRLRSPRNLKSFLPRQEIDIGGATLEYSLRDLSMYLEIRDAIIHNKFLYTIYFNVKFMNEMFVGFEVYSAPGSNLTCIQPDLDMTLT